MSLELYKKGFFSYERKVKPVKGKVRYENSNDESFEYDIVEARKAYWEKLIDNESFSLGKYWDTTDNGVCLLLQEKDYDVEMNDDLREWESMIESIDSGEFERVTIPDFKTIDAEGNIKDNSPVFVSFFIPFIRYSVGKLHEAIQSRNLEKALSDNGEKDLISILTQRLYGICYRTLILELNVSREEGKLCGASPEDRLQFFSETLLADRNYRNALLQEYPVMYRLMSICIHNWIKNSVEMLMSFVKDKKEIEKTFFDGTHVGSILRIKGSISDAHNGGKSVFVLGFDGEKKVIYKPRSMDLDIKFNQIIKWYNEKKSDSLFTPSFIDKKQYGWMEFIENKKCSSDYEISEFYSRMGVLLAVLFVTRTTDIHYENIIAYIDNPVIIDIEAMFHNRIDSESLPGVNGKIMNMIEDSVREVGILPRLTWGNDSHDGVDISALGGDSGQTIPIEVPIVKDAMTDSIQIEYGFSRLKKSNNSPSEMKINVDDYKQMILEGFAFAYKTICEHKEEFTEIIEGFSNTKVRQILRGTQHYASLLNIATHPDYLRSALDREMLFTTLYKGVARNSRLFDVTRFEIKDLLVDDIPYFCCYTNKRDLENKNGMVNGFFKKDSLSLAVHKIKSMNQSDYHLQERLINLSFVGEKEKKSRVVQIQSYDSKEIEKISSKALNIARKIGDTILDTAIYSDDKTEANWISTNVTGVKETEWSIEAAGLDLYNGISGILLFLAELYRITHEEKYYEILRKGLRCLIRTIDEDLEVRGKKVRPIAFGGFSGETSVIGALLRICKIIGMDIPKECHRIIELISNKIETDENYDVISGVSGCVFQLLNLYNETEDEKIIALARRCGDHLLKTAEKKGEMYYWKPLCASSALAGYSHGSSGMAVALAKLGKVLNERKYIDAAIKSLNYERSLFIENEGNWADIRKFDEVSNYDKGIVPVAWCHGAAGVLLGRIQLMRYLKGSREYKKIESEMYTALYTTMHKGFGSGHCLCHGDMGNIDILLYAYYQTRDEKIKTFIYSYINSIIPELEKGEFACGLPGNNSTPGLMLGISGIGYELLRICDNTIPSVLTLEIIGEKVI